MNRPLALIQGNLALPNARSLRGLPPPYGVYRWPPGNAAQRRPQSAVVTAAHQVIRDVARRNSLEERRIPFAPGQNPRFFYKLPKPFDNSSCFDAQMAESRHYLEMGMTRWYSSRADRMLGGMIFLAGSIALAWLLTATATATATRDADKTATMAIAQPSAAMPGATQPSVEVALKPARSARVAAAATPKSALRSESKPWLQALLPGKPHANSKSTSTRPRESQFDEHRAATHAIRPAIRSVASMQPEWPQHSSPDADAIAQPAWLDWTIAQQQHRRASVTTRANTSAPAPNDTDWNAHMTQRRITDNPSVFAAPSAQN
ncbi:hypothetical protein FVF58_14400 [Paraburkholderia panacisoli]|uniref:Uncharacterized protein n=1 Tax=Paraburkholderia panacisoli TaxID=2603818 RepID=A0A5B0H9N6_9BURK|nr:hypothetical protein [Paraburkholderia panacisoli]KAA1011683.1 hypothetical protein FVF58_14400 [Paraburkholderia panacisoli]